MQAKNSKPNNSGKGQQAQQAQAQAPTSASPLKVYASPTSPINLVSIMGQVQAQAQAQQAQAQQAQAQAPLKGLFYQQAPNNLNIAQSTQFISLVTLCNIAQQYGFGRGFAVILTGHNGGKQAPYSAHFTIFLSNGTTKKYCHVSAKNALLALINGKPLPPCPIATLQALAPNFKPLALNLYGQYTWALGKQWHKVWQAQAQQAQVQALANK